MENALAYLAAAPMTNSITTRVACNDTFYSKKFSKKFKILEKKNVGSEKKVFWFFNSWSFSLTQSLRKGQTNKKKNPHFNFFFWPTYFIHLSDITVRCCGLYYKPTISVKDDSRVVNKLETSLTDDAGVVSYDRHVFIVQATGCEENSPTHLQCLMKLGVVYCGGTVVHQLTHYPKFKGLNLPVASPKR